MESPKSTLAMSVNGYRGIQDPGIPNLVGVTRILEAECLLR